MRAAILGCGRAGAQHAAAVTGAGGRVVAVCDEDAAAARALAAGLRVPRSGLTAILDDPAVDVVAVCTPPDSHLELGIKSLAAGKAVVIEKPPALTRKGVEELETAGRLAGRPLAVMLQHRGRLPEVALASPWTAGASAVVEVFRERAPERYAERGWRGDPRRSGGGFFAHLAIHYTDLACQLLGEPEEIHALVEVGRGEGLDVRCGLIARMASGALLSVHASALPKARQERLCVLDGDRSLTISNHETRYVENGRETIEQAEPTPLLRAAVYAEVDASLRSGRPVRRFALGAGAASVALVEHVAGALVEAAGRGGPGFVHRSDDRER
jgi:predicted dehydrogenase